MLAFKLHALACGQPHVVTGKGGGSSDQMLSSKVMFERSRRLELYETTHVQRVAVFWH